MRILVVTQAFAYDIVTLSQSLKAQSNTVDIFCFDAYGWQRQKGNFDAIYAIDWTGKPFDAAWILRALANPRTWTALFRILFGLLWKGYDVVYARAETNRWCVAGSWWFQRVRKVPLAYNPYDVTSFQRPSDRIPRLERKAERFLFRECRGMVCKISPAQLPVLRQVTPHLPDKVLHFLPFVPARLLPELPGRKECGAPPRVVHVGGMALADDDAYYDPSLLEDRLAELARQAGAEFHAYPRQFTKNDDSDWKRISDMAAACPALNLHKGHPPSPRFLSLLSRYDYGWYIVKFHPSMPPHYVATTFGSKIFTYIGAGLPIITVKDFTCISDYLTQYGIGIVLDNISSEELKERLASADYAGMRQRVLDLRRSVTLEANIHRLTHFFAQLKKDSGA